MQTKREKQKEQIVALRGQGLSYQAVADKLDLDKSYVWRVANDKYTPHPRSKLADAPRLDPEQLQHNNTPLVRGEIAERATVVKLLERGFDVWIPAFTRHRADVGIVVGNKLVRIQVKLAGYDEGTNRFRCSLTTKRRGVFYLYDEDEVDFFVVKCDGLDEFYILPTPIANQSGYVNLYPHREKLTSRGDNYEIYRNAFELLLGDE